MTGTAKQNGGGSAGFTLIELLVSITVFSLLLLIVMSIFSRFVFVQRRDIGEQALQEDLRFALEMFNREVRTGFGTTFVATANGVTFRNQNGACVHYRLLSKQWQRAEVKDLDPTILCEGVVYTGYESLTSKTTQFDQLLFTVQAAQTSGPPTNRLTRQGFIIVTVSAQAAQKAQRPINLQSAVTSRQVNPYRTTP